MSKPEFVYLTYIETAPDKLWAALFIEELEQAYRS